MKKRTFFEILYLFFISLTPLFWFQDKNQILLGHDSGFRPDGFLHLYNTFFSWTSIANFGFDWTLFKGFLITQLPEAVFTYLFKSLHYGEILTFIFWFFVMALSMYIFLRSLFPDKKYMVLRLFGSTFYVYNFFLLQGWFIAERAKFSLFAALPLGLLIIYKTLNKEYSILKGSIFFGLVFFLLNGGGFPSLYGGVILVYLITFAYLTVANYLKTGIRAVFDSLITGVGFLVSLILLNAYWLLPQYYVAKTTYATSLGAQGGIEGILAWEAVISKYASFLNLLRLQGIPDWYNNPLHPYANEYLSNPILIIASFIPMIIIILGMFFKRKYTDKKTEVKGEKIINLIFVIFFVGLIFTAGSHPPTGKFYTLLIQYLPGFPIFRSGFYKFGPALWFSMIFLASYYLNFLINNFIKKKDQILQVFVLSILLLLAYHYPFFQGNFFNWNKPFTTKVVLPDYVSEAAKYISDNISNNSKILLLPELHPYYKSDGYSWGFWSVWPLPYTVAQKSYVSNDTSGNQKISDEIYNAANEKNKDLFSKLTGITGIDKILWRGDVLYINKTITSNDLIKQKDIVGEVGASRLKTYGKWDLYSLSSPYFVPLFYSPSKIEYLDSDSDLSSVLRTLNTKERSATLYGNSKLLDVSNEEAIEANCVFCEEESFKNMQNEVEIPKFQLLPDSLFVLVNDIKEYLLLSKIKRLNQMEKIDLYLTLSNNKLSQDISLFKKGQNERTQKLHQQILNSYNNAISKVLSYVQEVKEGTKNYYLMKIASYLLAQRRDLISNKGFYPNEDFASLYVNIDEKIKKIEPQIWVSDSTHKRYEFNINNTGEYAINISKESVSPVQVNIDGNIVSNTESVRLEQGYHRMEITYPEPENLLENFTVPSKITLKFNENIKYEVKDFSPQNNYLINLSYRRIAGRFGEPFHVSQWRDKVGGGLINRSEFGLDSTETEGTISYVLKPELGAKILSLSFSQPNFTFENSVFEITNFKVTKVLDPKVFLTRNLNQQISSTPQIEFKRINPTKYIVHINNAQKPFALIFGENFNPSWKIYYPKQPLQNVFTGNPSIYFGGEIKDFTSNDYLLDPLLTTPIINSVKEKNHFKANGYANGWYINKTGSFDMIIEYKPQRLVYIGILISVVSLGIALAYLAIRRRNEKN